MFTNMLCTKKYNNKCTDVQNSHTGMLAIYMPSDGYETTADHGYSGMPWFTARFTFMLCPLPSQIPANKVRANFSKGKNKLFKACLYKARMNQG